MCSKQKPAAEPEAERLRGLQLVGQRGVAQLQSLERVPGSGSSESVGKMPANTIGFTSW